MDASKLGGLPFRLSATQMATRRWSCSDDVIGRSVAGVGGIGLYRPKLSEAFAVEKLTASGLRVTTLSWLGGLLDDYQNDAAEREVEVHAAVEEAQRTGAERLVIATGCTGGFSDRHGRRLLADRIRDVADVAAERTVRVALEMFTTGREGRPSVGSVTELLRLQDAVDRGNVDLVVPGFAAVRDDDVRRRASVIRIGGEETGPARFIGRICERLAESGFSGVVEYDVCESSPGPMSGRYLRRLQAFRHAAAKAGSLSRG